VSADKNINIFFVVLLLSNSHSCCLFREQKLQRIDPNHVLSVAKYLSLVCLEFVY